MKKIRTIAIMLIILSNNMIMKTTLAQTPTPSKFNIKENKTKNRKHKKHAPYQKYKHLPKWKTTVRNIPKTAIVLQHHNVKYHYHSGIFYLKKPNGYIISKPPIGLIIKSLPTESIHISINDKNIYYYYGGFYEKASTNIEYIVIEPPIGATINALPEGYEVKIFNNERYYLFEGILYKNVISENGANLYEVTHIE